MKSFPMILILFAIKCSLYQSNEETLERGYFDDSDINMRFTPPKRYFHTKEELELTKAVPIIDNQPCNDVHPLSVFIHAAGQTSGKYFDRRQTTRNTWVRELKSLNVSVYFAIALNKDEKINAELKKESDTHRDMIQFAFIDAYFNLTLKAISILRWIDKNCRNSEYILKTDDDVIVNSQLLLDSLGRFETGISGCLGVQEDIPRDPTSKNLMNYFFISIFCTSFHRKTIHSIRSIPTKDCAKICLGRGLYDGRKHNSFTVEVFI